MLLVLIVLTAVTTIGIGIGVATESCAIIKDGSITDSAGNPVILGFDQFGYNYQAHLFEGMYDSSDRNIDGTYWGSTGDYVDDKLIMK